MANTISIIPKLKESGPFLSRKNWPDYFMANAFLAGEQSTCLRRKVGCVAVRDKRIIATGFNGQVAGSPHCKTCLREELKIPSGERFEVCRALHAEQNVIIQAAQFGVSLLDSVIYQTTKPCITCFKMLANVGVSEIIYEHDYPDKFMDLEVITCDWDFFEGPNGFFSLLPKIKSFSLKKERIPLNINRQIT